MLENNDSRKKYLNSICTIYSHTWGTRYNNIPLVTGICIEHFSPQNNFRCIISIYNCTNWYRFPHLVDLETKVCSESATDACPNSRLSQCAPSSPPSPFPVCILPIWISFYFYYLPTILQLMSGFPVRICVDISWQYWQMRNY